MIGVYSLTAMILYVLASPFLNINNSVYIMLFGIIVLMFCGFGYFLVSSFWSLLFLRILIGVGQFCIGSGAMTLLMSVIPTGKSGQAFSIYSVSFLVSYGCVPALMETLAPLIPTPPYGYAAISLTLLPAAWVILHIRKRQIKQSINSPAKKHVIEWRDFRSNLTRLPVVLLLILNICYFSSWSSLFYLFKGFSQKQSITNVGVFFSVQTGLMIVLRVLAGHFFDKVGKTRLISVAFITIATGYLILDRLHGGSAVPFVGILFGLGTGIGYPAINGLMYQISPPHLRSVNANLMMFAVQSSFFLGPVLGGSLVAHHDYHGYFIASAIMALVAAAISSIMARHVSTT